MNLMLALLLACVTLGLVARRFGAREHVVITLLAVLTTTLYYVFRERLI